MGIIYHLFQASLGVDYLAFIKCPLCALCQNKLRALLWKTLCLNKAKNKRARVDIYRRCYIWIYVFLVRKNKQTEYDPPLSLLWHCGNPELKCWQWREIQDNKVVGTITNIFPSLPLFRDPLFSSHFLCKSKNCIKHI